MIVESIEVTLKNLLESKINRDAPVTYWKIPMQRPTMDARL